MKITNMEYLGDEIDVSSAFYTLGNTYFLASDLTDYDPERQSGTLNGEKRKIFFCRLLGAI